MTQEEKTDVIDDLNEAYGRAKRLESILILKGKTDEANDLAVKNDKLLESINQLLGQSLDAWLADSVNMAASLKNANDDLKSRIDDIKKDIDTAENIVKAVGFIDDAVEIAARLLV